MRRGKKKQESRRSSISSFSRCSRYFLLLWFFVVLTKPTKKDLAQIPIFSQEGMPETLTVKWKVMYWYTHFIISIMSNWVLVDLPKALVERISDLCLPPDYIRMQSVCKSWQLILKKRRQYELPWLMMQNEADPDALDFFSIVAEAPHHPSSWDSPQTLHWVFQERVANHLRQDAITYSSLSSLVKNWIRAPLSILFHFKTPELCFRQLYCRVPCRQPGYGPNSKEIHGPQKPRIKSCSIRWWKHGGCHLWIWRVGIL